MNHIPVPDTRSTRLPDQLNRFIQIENAAHIALDNAAGMMHIETQQGMRLEKFSNSLMTTGPQCKTSATRRHITQINRHTNRKPHGCLLALIITIQMWQLDRPLIAATGIHQNGRRICIIAQIASQFPAHRKQIRFVKRCTNRGMIPTIWTPRPGIHPGLWIIAICFNIMPKRIDRPLNLTLTQHIVSNEIAIFHKKTFIFSC